MGYIPEGAKWYIAEIVEEITVEDDQRNVVHVNFNLIRADSPEEAYEKAIDLGQNGETEYLNSEGKRVNVGFRGLRDLNVIYDQLEHGAELMYEEKVAVSPECLQELLRAKQELEVFRAWKTPDPSNHPDYGAKEIIQEVEERFGLKLHAKSRSLDSAARRGSARDDDK